MGQPCTFSESAQGRGQRGARCVQKREREIGRKGQKVGNQSGVVSFGSQL